MTRSRALTAAGLACVAATFACLFAGLWFQGRKHTRSGVPNHFYPVREGERYFYVPKGGGAVGERPQVPITAGQYDAWKEDEQTGGVLVALCVPCLVAAVCLGRAAGRAD